LTEERYTELRSIRYNSWVRFLPDVCMVERDLAGYMGQVHDIWGNRNDQVMVYIPRLGRLENVHVESLMLCCSGAKGSKWNSEPVAN
jgi:hypothetical protein